jgi:tetratricopeptide (TPR) repeat protein
MRAALTVVIAFGIGSLFLAQQPSAGPNSQSDPAAILADAQSLYRKASFDPAIARYNEALKLDAHSGAAYAGMIRCYLKQDKVREADDALQKGLQANPAYPDLKVAEAELLFRQGEIPEAGKLFEEVIAAPPDPAQPSSGPNAGAYLGAARVATASALYGRAYILITRAHAIDPADPDVRKLWMQTLSGAERAKALQEYLGQTTNDGPDTRKQLTENLDLLKASEAIRTSRSAQCQPVSNVTATKTTMVPISLGTGAQGSGLAVQINGKPSRLLLDTGASGILISGKLANVAGLKPFSDVRMGGFGDRPDSQAHLALAESVRIGEMEFQNCPVYLVDRLGQNEDGLIGTDVFSQFLVELDFPASLMHLSQLPARPGEAPAKGSLKTSGEELAMPSEASSETGSRPATAKFFDRYIAPEMHSYVPAYRFGHMLLVPTTVDDKQSKLFLLDTGSFDNTISTAAAQEVTKIHRAPRLDVHGMNGEVKKVYVADRVTLDFGHLRQTIPNIVALDMSRTSRAAGTEVSGTLGMVMLGMLKIRLDYRDALADFEYTKRPPRH